MSVLDRIEKTDLRDFLGKGWLTHDGMWFYHTCQELGIDRANALNKAAIKTMAPIEMERAKRVLGIDRNRFDNFDDFKNFILEALELILPASVFEKSHFSSPERDLINWYWESGQCFAYKGMKQIEVIDKYCCGVMYRIECWLDALGIKYSMYPRIEGCLMHEKGICEGKIQVFLHG
ncbi:MAG: hypothetical protein HF978_12040 [Desulfobacteraceae bacterium]|nr:hypothetical protein [Desulfobacteraceae bacterium]MBC2756267.1 hypothetical protein [Desulfobacteraceae bacterium]